MAQQVNVLYGEKITEDFPKHSAGWMVHEQLKRNPGDAVLLVELESGREYTNAMLTETAERIADNLRTQLAIMADETLALVCTNIHQFWTVTLACMFTGNPLHLISPHYSDYELEWNLAISKPSVVFTCARRANAIMRLRSELNVKHVVALEHTTTTTTSYDGTVTYAELCRNCTTQPFRCYDSAEVAERVAFVFNSSGTTGLPKGVMVTHESLHLNIIYSHDDNLAALDGDKVTLMVAPLFHVYGMNITLAYMYRGAKVILMDQFKPAEFVQAMATYRVDRLFLVPALVDFLATLDDAGPLASLREIFCAAGAVQRDVAMTVCRKYGLAPCGIRQIYSLTELVAAVCVTPLEGAPDGSIGRLTPGHSLRILLLDDARRQAQPAGVQGEIWVQGCAMKGYLGNVQATNETLDREGFVRTGDLGYYDAQGFVYVVDRLKDIIRYKSHQVSPAHIEHVIMQLDGVLDVGVVGRQDQRAGEVPVAFVVRRASTALSEHQVQRHVEKHLSKEKWLRGGVVFVDAIPRNAVGKILRKNLREML